MRVYTNNRGTTGLSLGPLALLIIAPIIVSAWLIYLSVLLLITLARGIIWLYTTSKTDRLNTKNIW